MNWRWVTLWALALAAGAGAGAEGRERDDDEVPEALDDDDTEVALHEEESRNVHPRAYQQQAAAAYNALPSGFRPSVGGGGGQAPSLAELAGYSRPQQQQQQQQQQSQQQLQQHPRQGGESRVVRPSAVQRQHTEQAERDRGERGELEEDEEREVPDRLSTLLQQSRFDCGAKAGYYADEELHCEVFHHCQDGVKHSWICPEGFTFHQVHLICMPPTQESICQQSQKYHFVNDYLYRPLNTEEVARKPSTPLRYSERYYPAEVYHDERRDFDDEEDEEQDVARPTARAPAPTARPAAPSPSPHAPTQVFRSAEEVNIPLLQRRPQRPYEFHF